MPHPLILQLLIILALQFTNHNVIVICETIKLPYKLLNENILHSEKALKIVNLW